MNTGHLLLPGQPGRSWWTSQPRCDIAKRALAEVGRQLRPSMPPRRRLPWSVGDKTISGLNATKLTEHKFDEAAKGIAAFDEGSG